MAMWSLPNWDSRTKQYSILSSKKRTSEGYRLSALPTLKRRHLHLSRRPKVFEGAFEDLESRSESVLCVRLSMLLDSLELKYASTLFSLLCEKNCGGWGCGRVAARAGGLEGLRGPVPDLERDSELVLSFCTMSLASSRQDASADLAVVPGFSPASPVPKKRKVVEFSARMPPVGFFPAVWYCDGSIALNLVFDPSSFSSRGAAMAKAISFRLPPSQ
eukprot:CAMPEP_0196639288 /NCGR_PEP_ID=MMETSP1085-20130531/1917_1 /TAXON_ID=41879 ORGANISM="Pycnococcus sp, Strain CCMP1998" /NCGR_SAMPLE_ID=MMETSP1085 /ASSEMBLY_ACC=CAM_ASM_000807 /LENGTH=216 /DNA_ID=CAMNT_0041968299 /DNA_START=293 /DNA_END=940 /DNA_ORIENTATION=-